MIRLINYDLFPCTKATMFMFNNYDIFPCTIVDLQVKFLHIGVRDWVGSTIMLQQHGNHIHVRLLVWNLVQTFGHLFRCSGGIPRGNFPFKTAWCVNNNQIWRISFLAVIWDVQPSRGTHQQSLRCWVPRGPLPLRALKCFSAQVFFVTVQAHFANSSNSFAVDRATI